MTVDELAGYSRATVVGVVGDVVSGRLVDGAEPGHIYFPTDHTRPQAAALLLRGHAERDLSAEVQQQLFRPALDNRQGPEALPLDEMRALQVYPVLAIASVGSLMGLVALVLSVSGLYGVLVYVLSQRTREIGVRIALGATAAAIMRLVVLQSLRLAGVGAIVGVVAAWSVLKVLSAAIQLQGVSLFDATAFGGALTLVVAAAALAASSPARRAARVDPVQSLRVDG
jgi:ABC-type antimicrobial peptide transport system permease subunit